MKKLTLTLLAVFLMASLNTSFKVNAMENSKIGDLTINQSQCTLKRAQEKLWIDHIS